MAHRIQFTSKNLDVPETSRDLVSQAAKGIAGDLKSELHLSVVSSDTAHGEKQRRRYRPRGSKYLSLDQATNIIEAVDYARTVDLPLVAHATIHWSGTVAFDDPDGKLFAKVREGLHKWLLRRGIAGGLTCVWCRECKAHTDIVHCHSALSLARSNIAPAQDCSRLRPHCSDSSDRHGGGILGEFAVKLMIHPDPDGLYLIKGGDREVWDHFHIRKEWRRSQGIIHGKRCGTTQNIGRATRNRRLTERGAA